MNSSTTATPVAFNPAQNSTLRKNILRAAIIQALACSSGALYAANITVTSVADAVPAVTDDGNCTLREAIEAANTDAAVDNCTAGAGADTISFDNTLSGSTVTLGGSQLDIASDLTVDGDLDDDGAPDITIDAAGASRVIYIDATAATRTVTLDGLTISNGNPNTGVANGAGVHCQGSIYGGNCNLTLSNSRVTGNTATSTSSVGGGVSVDTGALTVTNSTITNNTAGRFGGGIFAGYYNGTTTITNSTISGNTAQYGAGLFAFRDLTLTDSTVADNTASGAYGEGGGVQSGYGSIALTNSTVSGNTTAGSGGGVRADSGSVTLTNSTVSGNTSGGNGGGIRADYGIILTNSTVSGNTATGNGGGMRSVSGSITLTNSTVSGNSAGGSGGALFSFASVSFTNSTITANNAANSGAGVEISTAIPGSNPTLSALNSIVANNTLTGSTTLSDCVSPGVAVNADAGNLVTDTSNNCGLSPVSTADPMLGALADNGGATQTHLPQAGSPVLDAGDNTNCPATDQRGANRDDGACDIGSVEGTVSLIPPSVIQFDAITATVSEDGGTVVIGVTRSGNTNTAVSVDYATADGSATTPADYTGDMNTLNFGVGETTQTVTVTITDDADEESDETFTVTLSNAQLVSGSGSAELGANTSTTVTITDNDAAVGGGSTTTTSTTSTSDNDGFLGIGALHPWWLLMGLAAWLRRGFRKA